MRFLALTVACLVALTISTMAHANTCSTERFLLDAANRDVITTEAAVPQDTIERRDELRRLAIYRASDVDTDVLTTEQKRLYEAFMQSVRTEINMMDDIAGPPETLYVEALLDRSEAQQGLRECQRDRS